MQLPWVHSEDPPLIGIETSGRQELWGTVDEVIEVVNHVPGTVPVLNMAHIHARGHGCMRTSEDYAELFEKVRTESRRQQVLLPLRRSRASNGQCITLHSDQEVRLEVRAFR